MSLQDGYLIQVGDIITSTAMGTTKKHVVHRVTKTLAFVRYNDVAEGKFRRVYNSFCFGPIPREHYSMVDYKLIPKHDA